MKQLHEQIDATIYHSISRADFQFSQYLDERGVGDFVDHSNWAILGETGLVGDWVLYTCLMEYALREGIPSEHVGVIRSRLFQPKVFGAILAREPLRFGGQLLETATPTTTVNTFAGALFSVLGVNEVMAWFISALGAAVHAADEVCVAHFKSLEEAESRPTLFPRPTARERTVARLGAAVQLLKPRKNSPATPAPQMPSKRSFLDLSLAKATTSTLLPSSGDVGKLWLSNAQKFTAGALSIARKEYEAFTTAPQSRMLVDFFRRGAGLFLESSTSPPSSPSRFRRSRAPSPASPSRHVTFHNAAPSYDMVFRRGKGLFPKSPALPPPSPTRGFRRSRAPSPASPSRRVDLDNAASPHGLALASVPKRRKVAYPSA
ncbi:hypothetical protein FB45DRAFT_42606 [Roridomyces roridus]|uniref:Uncharacterized protein n=1 Tax=Roridomyces roridus TaxID=1738132 RepID=A0AAD7FMG5_9AGAR|nr:hypothetical protein FB45DRAFT_42606 [Roridomyces roridus]